MFIYLNFINCVCLYLTNYNKISQSTIINSHYSNRFSTQICTRLHIRPLHVLQATMRTRLVKGPGGISAPAIRRPWNVMSHTLMHVARRSLNQKELVLVAIGHGRRSPCQLVATRFARHIKTNSAGRSSRTALRKFSSLVAIRETCISTSF